MGMPTIDLADIGPRLGAPALGESARIIGVRSGMSGYFTPDDLAAQATVPSIDALRSAAAGPWNGYPVLVRNYYADADGGGGTFLWNGTSTAADDGGLVIKPASVSGPGRWKRQLVGSVFNVKWWGARGNGAANDTAPIQAATNAAVDAGFANASYGLGRACVLFPGGNYLSGGLLAAGAVAFQGLGQNITQLTQLSGSTAPLLTVNAQWYGSNEFTNRGLPANIEVHGLLLTHQNVNDSAGNGVAHGILIGDAVTNPVSTKLVLRDVTLLGFPGSGISTASGGWGNGTIDAQNVLSRYNKQSALRMYGASDTRWIGCDFGGLPSSTAPLLDLSGGVSNHFQNCYIYGSGTYNVSIYGGNVSFYFRGCYFDIPKLSHIALQIFAGNSVRGNTGKSIVEIDGCTFRWFSQAGAGAASGLSIVSNSGAANSVLRIRGSEFIDLANLFAGDLSSAYDVEFLGGTGTFPTVVIAPDNVFDRGSSYSRSSLSNRTDLIKSALMAA